MTFENNVTQEVSSFFHSGIIQIHCLNLVAKEVFQVGEIVVKVFKPVEDVLLVVLIGFDKSLFDIHVLYQLDAQVVILSSGRVNLLLGEPFSCLIRHLVKLNNNIWSHSHSSE